MAGLKRTPKKPPTRRQSGREQVQRPIREVITHPSSTVPVHAVKAANTLKGTIKGNTGGRGKGDGGLPTGPDGRVILKPLPAHFNVKPDGSFMTPNEVYTTYASSGAYDISQAQIDSYTQLYNQAVAARQARNSIGTLVDSIGNVIEDIPGIVTGDAATIADANAQATAAMNVIRGSVGQPQQHIATQTRVGGTKGSATIVDRSAAIRKAWETRKKRYGSSGQKDK